MRTLEEALSYLDYHRPDNEAQIKHQVITNKFQDLLRDIWDILPDGPGKTVAIREIGTARMLCNSCIANKGN